MAGIRAVSLGLVLLLAGCGTGEPAQKAGHRVSADGLNALPFATLQDWVSYGAQVAEVTVTGERETRVPAEASWRESPVSSRIVDVSVTRTLWHASGTSVRTGSVSFTADGWAYTSTGRSPVVEEDGPRLEVGQAYVIPFAEFTGGFAPLATGAVLHLTADRRIELVAGQRSPGPRQLDGLTPAEAASRLAQVRPDPAADARRSLPPEERWRAVVTERRARAG
jgi:hypothetical protein